MRDYEPEMTVIHHWFPAKTRQVDTIGHFYQNSKVY